MIICAANSQLGMCMARATFDLSVRWVCAVARRMYCTLSLLRNTESSGRSFRLSCRRRGRSPVATAGGVARPSQLPAGRRLPSAVFSRRCRASMLCYLLLYQG
jgi:hypothetical protein